MAQLLTTTHKAGDPSRRATALALLSASGGTVMLALAGLSSGGVRAAAVAAAVLFALCGLVFLSQASEHRRRERLEEGLLAALVQGLPPRWYILGSLVVEPSWLEPVRIWAVVVSPGGLAVVQPCSEGGSLTPMGHLWAVRRGKSVRAIPSPAATAATAVEALREVLGTDLVPIVPVVALTDLNAIFHEAEAGARVAGAPHVAPGLQQILSGSQRIWDAFQLAAFLSRYHR